MGKRENTLGQGIVSIIMGFFYASLWVLGDKVVIGNFTLHWHAFIVGLIVFNVFICYFTLLENIKNPPHTI